MRENDHCNSKCDLVVLKCFIVMERSNGSYSMMLCIFLVNARYRNCCDELVIALHALPTSEMLEVVYSEYSALH